MQYIVTQCKQCSGASNAAPLAAGRAHLVHHDMRHVVLKHAPGKGGGLCGVRGAARDEDARAPAECVAVPQAHVGCAGMGAARVGAAQLLRPCKRGGCPCTHEGCARVVGVHEGCACGGAWGGACGGASGGACGGCAHEGCARAHEGCARMVAGRV